MERQEQIQRLIEGLIRKETHLSYSSLSAFAESPKHFIEHKLRERTQTPSMFYGNVVHTLILEPEMFDSRYAVMPECDRRTKAGKEMYAQFEADNEGKAIITQDILEDAQRAQMSVKTNFPANSIISKCPQKEVSVEWEYENFKFMGRLDMKGERIAGDLKTCADASPRKFQRDIIAMDYHLQAAMYLKGIGEIIPYYIVAVDKAGGVSVHLLEKALIEVGFERYKILMEKLNTCILLDGWSKSYDFYSERYDGVFMCDKPAYLY